MNAAAIDNYQAFLNLRSEPGEDARVSDAGQRLERLRQSSGR